MKIAEGSVYLDTRVASVHYYVFLHFIGVENMFQRERESADLCMRFHSAGGCFCSPAEEMKLIYLHRRYPTLDHSTTLPPPTSLGLLTGRDGGGVS